MPKQILELIVNFLVSIVNNLAESFRFNIPLVHF